MNFTEHTLENIRTAYINLDEQPERDKSINQVLANFTDVTRIPAVKALENPGPSGLNRSRAIANSHETALNTMGPGMCLILEDDCQPYNYRSTIYIPEDADLLFLGLWQNPNRQAQLDNGVFRVVRMVGAHAILYVTERAKAFMREVLTECYETGDWHDYHMSLKLHTVNAYAQNLPVFYQTSEQKNTQLSITD
jgi:hypothetical protein